MSTGNSNGGGKYDLVIKTLGATLGVVLVTWMLTKLMGEMGVRQDLQIAENRRQMLELTESNRQHLEQLLAAQTAATLANAAAMDRLGASVDRVNVGVESISKLGFGQVLNAISKATQATEKAAETAKPEPKP